VPVFISPACVILNFSIELFSNIISFVAFTFVSPETSSIRLFKLFIDVVLLPILVLAVAKSFCKVVIADALLPILVLAVAKSF
jgi:hypothetical protein